MQEIKHSDIDCIEVVFGNVRLNLTRSVGPRILTLSYMDFGNIFADLPQDFLKYPEGGKFHFYGGHRLWVSPEVPAITYAPDDQPVEIDQQKKSIEVTQAAIQGIGLEKKIRISQTDFDDIILVEHVIRNVGELDRKLAPWAITQMKVGGRAVLPYTSPDADRNSFLPDRSVTLWPYTNINDARIEFDQDFIFISSSLLEERPLKIGVPHLRKWIAYFVDGLLFIKYSKRNGSDCALDLGAAGQCYCNNRFLELETLGPYQNVGPGESVNHREVWRVVEKPFNTLLPETIREFVKNDPIADVCKEML